MSGYIEKGTFSGACMITMNNITVAHLEKFQLENVALCKSTKFVKYDKLNAYEQTSQELPLMSNTLAANKLADKWNRHTSGANSSTYTHSTKDN